MAAISDLAAILDFSMVEIKRLPWSDLGVFLRANYLDPYKQVNGEWALLQILPNLSHSFFFWTIKSLSFLCMIRLRIILETFKSAK